MMQNCLICKNYCRKITFVIIISSSRDANASCQMDFNFRGAFDYKIDLDWGAFVTCDAFSEKKAFWAILKALKMIINFFSQY